MCVLEKLKLSMICSYKLRLRIPLTPVLVHAPKTVKMPVARSHVCPAGGSHSTQSMEAGMHANKSA